ncbi:heparinase, partial [Rhizobiaceae sp. 2RAB30]
LTGPGADSWRFVANGIQPTIEESIFFAGLSGPRRSRQIVISFKASEVPEMRWRLTRIATAAQPLRS